MIELIELKARAAIRTKVPTDHVFVVDVSGSMYHSLPVIRTHLKNNIGTMVKDNDTVSIVYFSGKNQFGTVLDKVKIASLSDLTEVHKSVDKYLHTIGLTSFVGPLELANTISSNSSNMKNLIFITDGHDNASSQSDIIKLVETLSFDKSTIIEYGNYCDRDLLAKMASVLGANHVFSDTIEHTVAATETAFETEVIPKQEVKVSKKVDHVVYIENNNLIMVDVKDSITLVPESVSKVYSINKAKIAKTDDDTFKYIGLWSALHLQDSDLMWECINVIGDIRLFREIENAFTKQELQKVKELVAECVVDETKRYTLGQKDNLVPRENAFTGLDLLSYLSDNDILIHRDTFSKYKSGTKKREAVDKETPKFTPYSYEFINANRLVFNEDRPNVSIGTTIKGSVNIPLQAQKDHKLPGLFETFIHKNYTIVRDGIVNVKNIITVIPDDKVDEFNKLVEDNNISVETITGSIISIDLTSIPLVNRQMVKNLNARKYFDSKLLMLDLKAKIKVLKEMRVAAIGLTSSANLKSAYGEEATEYLNSIGIRDYGYGSVSTKTVEATDFYLTTELNTKIATSTFPTTKKVLDKASTKGEASLNLGESLIYKYYNEFVGKDIDFIEQKEKTLSNMMKMMIKTIANMTYALIVSKSSFKDLPDNGQMMVPFEGKDIKCSVEIVHKEQKI